MTLYVVLSIDERLDDVKRCVDSIRKVYGNEAPIALATYGGELIGRQMQIEAYAKENGFYHYDAPRHVWIRGMEWHACEILARVQITKWFSDLGYGDIYIMHADVQILGDFRKHFDERRYGQWSFIAILLRAQESFKALCKKGSWALALEGNHARFADILTLYNPWFVMALYKVYGNDEGIYDHLLSKFMLWGDLGQFDLAREWNGYSGQYIKETDDSQVMCGGAVIHQARERIPDCLLSKVRMSFTQDEIRGFREKRK